MSLRNKPHTYRKWVRERGKVNELGAKAFMSDKLLEGCDSIEIRRMIINHLAAAFARTILYGGYSLPISVHHERERDAYLRGFEELIVTENYMEILPEQYMNKAFEAWVRAYSDLIVWEERSLWQYLTYWITRTWQLVKKKFNINQYKEDNNE